MIQIFCPEEKKKKGRQFFDKQVPNKRWYLLSLDAVLRCSEVRCCAEEECGAEITAWLHACSRSRQLDFTKGRSHSSGRRLWLWRKTLKSSLTFIYNVVINHNLTAATLWNGASEAEIPTWIQARMGLRRASLLLLEQWLFSFLFLPPILNKID